jgi:hypothetical protein
LKDHDGTKNKIPFLALLESGRPMLSDGAMGTVLHQRGISFDECFDALNLSQPAWWPKSTAPISKPARR